MANFTVQRTIRRKISRNSGTTSVRVQEYWSSACILHNITPEPTKYSDFHRVPQTRSCPGPDCDPVFLFHTLQPGLVQSVHCVSKYWIRLTPIWVLIIVVWIDRSDRIRFVQFGIDVNFKRSCKSRLPIANDYNIYVFRAIIKIII